MERNPNQISPNLILGKISPESTFTANEMPSPFSFGHNPQQYSQPFLCMRWWWIIFSTVVFPIGKLVDRNTKGAWPTQKESLPCWLHFYTSHFHLLVYKALVINPSIQSRSLGGQTKGPPIPTTRIPPTSHPLAWILPTFPTSHPSSSHPSQLVPHYGVSHLVPSSLLKCQVPWDSDKQPASP